tara:strand:+ start:1221 stop:2531 length:1311 start_codon:yes stop_codon:yes gene_type:complete
LKRDYCNLYFLDSFTAKVNMKRLDFDPKFEKQFNLESKEVSEDFDKKLLSFTKNNPSSKDSLLALRCRVSFPIYEKVNLIHKQFSNQYEIKLDEMLVILLDDSGDNYLRLPSELDSKKNKFIRKTFSWETILDMKNNKFIKPFSAEVISEYNPKLSNLSTWTRNKVQGNYDLKSYLKSFGLLLISPWALIADSSRSMIINAWERCGEGQLKLNYVEKIYNSYIHKYKKAKESYKQRTGKISGWIPDEEFLISLDPPQKNTSNLLLIDKAIRQYKSGIESARSFENNEENQIENNYNDDNDFIRKDLTQKINKTLVSFSTEMIKKIINQDKNKWGKDEARKLAWKLYGDGLSQRDIAYKCSHKQGWVSKLIPEKRIAEEIAQDAAIEILKIKELNFLKKDPDGMERLIETLKNYLLNTENKNNVCILRNLIKEEIIK